MLVKLSTLALIVPFVVAFTINPIANANGGDQVTISWSATSADPQFFSIELTNAAFHNTFAIANNAVTALGSITITLPQVQPGDGYTVEAVALDNVNQVYAQSSDFAIGATTTGSDTTTPTATSSNTAASTTSSLSTATDSTSSASLVTPSSTATVPVSSASSSVSAARSSTATSTPSSSSSSGAASFKSVGLAPAVALVLSAVAGAAVVF